MADSLGELFVELGVFADTKELKEFEEKLKKVSKTVDEAGKKTKKTNDNFKEMVTGIAGIATAISGAVLALNKLTQSLVENNQHFLNLTRTSDIALSSFQKWDNVGRMFGVKNAASQLENLNERLFELKLTGQGAQGFMLAGINPMGQSAEGIMEQLRGRVAGLDDTAAAYLLRQMGLDPSMLHLLRMSRAEFEELGATIKKYQLTEDQTKQIQAMNVQLQIAQIKFQYLKDRAILAIMPYFVRFMQSLAGITEMLANALKTVGQFIVKWRSLIAVFAVALARFTPVWNVLRGILTTIGGLITKLPIFGRFLGAIGSVAMKALLPFTALYLILDDLATYFQGGDSLIGRVEKWFQETGKDFSNIFGKMFGGDFWGGVGDLFIKLIDVLDDFVQALLRIVAVITGIPVDKWGKNFANFASQGKYEELKNYDYGANTPGIEKNVSNSRIDNDNRIVNMNNTIYTTETGDTVRNDLAYAQNYAFGFV